MRCGEGGREPCGGRAERGFSLVEMMLALVLGLVVVAGLTRLFAGSREGYALLHSQARLQESGRYALAFIGRSVRGAGDLGCNAHRQHILNGLNGDLDELFELDIGRALDVFDDAGGASMKAFARAAGIKANRVIPGTDILALRRVEAPLHRVVADVDANGEPIVEVRGSFDLRRGDFALLSDCEQASLFRITGVIKGAGRATLLRDVGVGRYRNAPVPLNSAAGKRFGPAEDSGGAAVGRVLTETYFIGPGLSADRRGGASRSLWRRSGRARPAELVEDIHDLQIAFGVDTRAHDGLAGINRLVGFHDVPSGAIVRAVNVRIAAGEPPALRTFAQTFAVRVAGGIPANGQRSL